MRDYEQEYRELLDEIYPTVKFGSLVFSASRIIEELDPIAFRCGLADWENEYYPDNDNDNDEKELVCIIYS